MSQSEEPIPLAGSLVPDEPPPLLGTWPRLYAAVLSYLILLIFLLYVFTRWARA